MRHAGRPEACAETLPLPYPGEAEMRAVIEHLAVLDERGWAEREHIDVLAHVLRGQGQPVHPQGLIPADDR